MRENAQLAHLCCRSRMPFLHFFPVPWRLPDNPRASPVSWRVRYMQCGTSTRESGRLVLSPVHICTSLFNFRIVSPAFPRISLCPASCQKSMTRRESRQLSAVRPIFEFAMSQFGQGGCIVRIHSDRLAECLDALLVISLPGFYFGVIFDSRIFNFQKSDYMMLLTGRSRAKLQNIFILDFLVFRSCF